MASAADDLFGDSPASAPLAAFGGGAGGDAAAVKLNIWEAASDGDVAAVQELVSAGIAVNSTDDYGYTPLAAAVSYGHAELAKWLLEQGADAKQVDPDGDTLLHLVEDAACAALVHAAGVALDNKNKAGLMPFDVARLESRKEVIEWLTSKSAPGLTHAELVSYAQAERAKVEAARAAEAGDAGDDDDGTEETVTLTLEELAQHMNLSDEDMAKFRAIASGQATMADVAGATETIAEGDEEEAGAAPATAGGAGGGAGADATS